MNVIGNPQGLEGTLSTGIISGIRRYEESTVFQISAPISPGSSGGPVLNGRGEVIGVAFLTLTTGQALNFAIPVSYLRALASAQSPRVSPLATLPPPTPSHPALTRPSPGWPESPGDRAAAEMLRATKEYRASLERLLSFYNSDLLSARGQLQRERDRYVRGEGTARDVKEAEGILADAEFHVEETRRRIDEADAVIREAEQDSHRR